MKNYSALVTLFRILPLLLIPPTQLMAQDSIESGNASLFQMISQGGWAMIPLSLCSLTLIYLIIHCFRETRPTNFGSDTVTSRVRTLCLAGNQQAAISETENDSTLLGRSLYTALKKDSKRTQNSDRLETFNNTVAESFELEENAVSQWIHYINVVAGVAPMVGLLGTVSGMIGAFQTMSAGGMGRPELLAGDIGEALITTATGLCIGIPAMVAYSYFNNRLNSAIMENAQRASTVFDSLAEAETVKNS